MNHPRNPRATLWAFSYNGLTDATVMSIFREWQGWPGLDFHIKGGDANIDRARSKVASWYLKEPEETAGSVLLMVDSDNAWQTGDLAYIAKRALEQRAVVGGVYSKRAWGQGVALRVASEGEWTIGEEELIPVDYVGTGFIAIPRDVLLAISETLPMVTGDFQPFFMPMVVEHRGNYEYPTDDVAFCARVREAGYPIFASTLPRLTHEGVYTYRVQDAYVELHPDQDQTISFQELAHVVV